MNSDDLTGEVDEEFAEMLEKVASANKDGLEKLAREEVAERRQNESKINWFIRVSKRKLGLRESDAVKISL